MKRTLLFSLTTILFLIGAVACGSAGAQSTDGLPTPTPLPTPVVPEKPIYEVQRGTVVNSLIFNARVSPVVEQELAFGRDGTVKEVNVAQGDNVAAGDVLAELDITDLEKAVRDAEIALETAEFNLEKAKLEHTEKILQAEIDMQKEALTAQKEALETSSISPITAKQLELQNAQAAVDGAAQAYQEALTNSNVEQSYVDSLARGLESAEQALLLAEAEYNDELRKSGTAAIDARIAELDQMLAENEYEKLLQGIDPSHEVEVEKAQLALEEAERKLGDAKLIAPFDGRILTISIKRGSQAQSLQTVIVIAQMEELELTANLNATDLAELSVNQTASIILRNRPEDELSGYIRTLPYPYGGGSGVGEDGNNETIARIAIDQDISLALGELAEVTVILEERDDVLWLPPAAIRRFQGRRFVVVQEGDAQRRVDVRVGIESEDRVEILEGVEEGMVIVGE
ncbi:MAG: HlyD family efflux transporter periplasmic adaptor subunit [Anaerolineales bacterium]|nr:HlyD family efflux transporter periplasmic adaptor subunit [Anaerolineales bacterium]